MDKNNDAKIIQAVFGFLEAVNGKKDNRAVSALIRGMIEEIMSTESSSVESGMPEETNPWFRLDHSLRSPMNGILGFTGILLDEISDPELKWKVEQIKVSAEKLMQLLEHSNIYRYRPPVSGATLQKEEAADKNTWRKGEYQLPANSALLMMGRHTRHGGEKDRRHRRSNRRLDDKIRIEVSPAEQKG